MHLKSSNTFAWITIALAIGLAATALAVWLQVRQNDVETRGALRSAAEQVATDVTERVFLYQYGVRGARGVILTAGVEGVTNEIFARYSRSRDITREFPGARGFGFIQRVPRDEEAEFIDLVHRDGRPDFHIIQLAPQDGERWVIRFIEPANLNAAAIGLDIASEPSRREAAVRSMRTGEPTITAPIVLLQNPDPNLKAFLIMLPVYRPGASLATPEEREAASVGWCYAALTMSDVMAQLRLDPRALHLRLRDVTKPGAEDLIYERAAATEGQDVYRHALQRDVYGRRWTIEVGAYPPFIEALNLTQPRSVALIGILASILLAALAGAESVSRRRKHLISARLADFNAQLERQVVERTEELTRAKAAAESANAARGRFLAMMSHELRTPMSGVLGMGDLLLGSDLKPEQRELLVTLIGSARALLDLLNDILDFAKIEAGRVELESVDFSVRTAVADVCTALAPLAREKGNIVEVAFDDSVGPAYRGDMKCYRQIFINLLGNANKFTHNGRISVRLRAVPRADGGLSIETSVADTGVGIAPENRDRLFHPFVQEDSSTSRRYGGTGLGLAISKTLAELMGGRIWLESEPGSGSTFTFSVALGIGDAGKVAAAAEAGARGGSLPGAPAATPLQVLVAEDNETNRMLAQRILTKMGHSVQVAENGAVAVAATQSREFDIILMDMQMPVMDGPTAMRIICGDRPQGHRVPIIALTADAMREHHDGYGDAGASVIMTKPVNWIQLGAEMERLTRDVRTRVSGPAAGSPAPGSIVIDTALLAEIEAALGGEMVRFVETMQRDMRVLVERLTEAAGRRDFASVRSAAHSIKGFAAQIGARCVADLAARAEALVKSGDWTDSLIPELHAAAAEFVEAFQAWRSLAGPATTSPP